MTQHTTFPILINIQRPKFDILSVKTFDIRNPSHGLVSLASIRYHKDRPNPDRNKMNTEEKMNGRTLGGLAKCHSLACLAYW